MPRKRHVSRNLQSAVHFAGISVMPRKRHVSRNQKKEVAGRNYMVMPRKRHVSRNLYLHFVVNSAQCHASKEACE